MRFPYAVVVVAVLLPSTASMAALHISGSVPRTLGRHIDVGTPLPKLQVKSVKAAIQSMYDRENAAAGLKDTHGMLKYVSPSFVGVDAKGKRITYHDLVDSAQQVVSMATTVQAGTIVRQCRVTGNKVVARVDDEVRIVVAVPDQTATHVDDISSANDTWTKTTTGWRLTSSHTITHKVLVDGQPADDDNMGLPSF